MTKVPAKYHSPVLQGYSYLYYLSSSIKNFYYSMMMEKWEGTEVHLHTFSSGTCSDFSAFIY